MTVVLKYRYTDEWKDPTAQAVDERSCGKYDAIGFSDKYGLSYEISHGSVAVTWGLPFPEGAPGRVNRSDPLAPCNIKTCRRSPVVPLARGVRDGPSRPLYVGLRARLGIAPRRV